MGVVGARAAAAHAALCVDALKDDLRESGQRAQLLFDLFGGQLGVSLRQVKKRLVRLRLDVAHFGDEPSATDALHVAARPATHLGIERQPRFFIDVDKALGRHVAGLRAGARRRPVTVFRHRSSLVKIVADALDALLILQLLNHLRGRHRAHIEAGHLRPQLGILLARRHDQVTLVGLVQKDDLSDGRKVEGIAAVSAPARHFNRQLETLVLSLGLRAEFERRAIRLRLARVDAHAARRRRRIRVDVGGRRIRVRRVRVDIGVIGCGLRLATRAAQHKGQQPDAEKTFTQTHITHGSILLKSSNRISARLAQFFPGELKRRITQNQPGDSPASRLRQPDVPVR